jgi:hypothetical protein
MDSVKIIQFAKPVFRFVAWFGFLTRKSAKPFYGRLITEIGRKSKSNGKPPTGNGKGFYYIAISRIMQVD